MIKTTDIRLIWLHSLNPLHVYVLMQWRPQHNNKNNNNKPSACTFCFLYLLASWWSIVGVRVWWLGYHIDVATGPLYVTNTNTTGLFSVVAGDMIALRILHSWGTGWSAVFHSSFDKDSHTWLARAWEGQVLSKSMIWCLWFPNACTSIPNWGWRRRKGWTSLLVTWMFTFHGHVLGGSSAGGRLHLPETAAAIAGQVTVDNTNEWSQEGAVHGL